MVKPLIAIIDSFRRFAYPFSIGMVQMEIDIEQMDRIMKLFESSSLTEITIEQDNYRLTLKKDSTNQQGHLETDSTDRDEDIHPGSRELDRASVESSEQVSVNHEGESTGAFFITSPIVGTFYTRPSPEDPPYVEEGDVVQEGDTVCIVEAMKVMNEVDADRKGKVVEICIEDGDPVEYGQQLYKLIPVETS